MDEVLSVSWENNSDDDESPDASPERRFTQGRNFYAVDPLAVTPVPAQLPPVGTLTAAAAVPEPPPVPHEFGRYTAPVSAEFYANGSRKRVSGRRIGRYSNEERVRALEQSHRWLYDNVVYLRAFAADMDSRLSSIRTHQVVQQRLRVKEKKFQCTEVLRKRGGKICTGNACRSSGFTLCYPHWKRRQELQEEEKKEKEAV